MPGVRGHGGGAVVSAVEVVQLFLGLLAAVLAGTTLTALLRGARLGSPAWAQCVRVVLMAVLSTLAVRLLSGVTW